MDKQKGNQRGVISLGSPFINNLTDREAKGIHKPLRDRSNQSPKEALIDISDL